MLQILPLFLFVLYFPALLQRENQHYPPTRNPTWCYSMRYFQLEQYLSLITLSVFSGIYNLYLYSSSPFNSVIRYTRKRNSTNFVIFFGSPAHKR